MPKGDNQPSKIDWATLCTRYREDRKANKHLTLNAWCIVNQISYTYASKQFAEIARLETAEMGSILAPEAMAKLGALINSKDETISSKVSTAILDRTGFSPKEQVINVQNNISLGVVMFSKEDEPTIKEMFGGSIIDDTSDSN